MTFLTSPGVREVWNQIIAGLPELLEQRKEVNING